MSLDDDSEIEELDWRVVRTLLEANRLSSESLESYYYHRHYRTDDDLREFTEFLQSAIRKHESIQEGLEALLMVIAETQFDD